MKLALLAFCLLSPLVAYAQQHNGGLHYVCKEDQSRIGISDSGAPPVQSNGKTEWIDFESLIEYAKENERGDVWRTGSASTTRQCGRLTLKVKGGYFNGNPQGEMGAAEDYPIIEISDDSGSTTGPMAIGSCMPSIARYSAMVECPKDWVTHLEASAGAQGMSIRAQHGYEKYRQPVKNMVSPTAH